MEEDTSTTGADEIHVLVVGDDADRVASSLEGNGAGFTVRAASGMVEAGPLLRDGTAFDGRGVDCIVGCQTSADGGIEFLESIREDATSLPIVLFTSVPLGTLAEMAMAAGVSGYVDRRNGDDQHSNLESTIREVVDGARRRDAVGEPRFRKLVEHSSDLLLVLDADGRIAYANRAYGSLVGRGQSDVVGEHALPLVHPNDRSDVVRTFDELVGEPLGTSELLEYRLCDPDGGWHVYESRFTNRLDDPTIAGVVVTAREITEREEAKAELEERVEQQQVLATIGKRALEMDLDELFDEAVHLVVDTLDTDMCTILELLPGGEDVQIREGVGYRPGVVGETIVDPDRASLARQTLVANEPMIVDDLRTDTRFTNVPVLTDHGVVSGLTAVIGSEDEPWGVLGTHSTIQRTFTDRDVDFVQGVANTLAAAIDRTTLQRERERILERITDGMFALDDEWRFTYLNDKVESFFEVSEGDLIGTRIWGEFSHLVDTDVYDGFLEAMETQEQVEFEYRSNRTDRWFEFRTFPSETGLSVYFRDVTEERRIRRELERSERSLHDVYETASDPQRSFEEKLARMLEIGCERLDLPIGCLTRIDDRTQEVVEAVGEHDLIQTGESTPLDRVYCRRTIEGDGLLAVKDAPAAGWEDDPAYRQFGLGCYVGGKVVVDDELYGTICFADVEARDRSFTDSELAFVELLTQWTSYELEQRWTRRELATQHTELHRHTERLRSIIETVPIVLFALDADGTFTLSEGSGLERLGSDPGDAIGASAFDVYEEYPGVVGDIERVLDGEPVRSVRELRGLVFETSYRPTRAEDGTVTGAIGVAIDVTERVQYEETLAGLHEVARGLLTDETPERIGQRISDAAMELLDFDHVNVYLFDDDRGVLERIARTDAVEFTDLDETAEFGPDERSISWRTFMENETAVFDDVRTDEDIYSTDTEARSAMFVPLADHGTINMWISEIDPLDEKTVELGELLAATAATALDRVEREADLRERDVELSRRNRRLTALNQINEIIREVDRSLVRAATREEIERAVCERLTASDRFAFAWIGELDPDGETLVPRAWAGTERGYLDAISLEIDADEPAARVARTGETVSVSNIASGFRDEPWRRIALECGFQSTIAVPIALGEITIGVLVAYTGGGVSLDLIGTTVIEELGETIAYAIDAVETKRALQSDRVVELDLRVSDADDPLLVVARNLDSRVSFEGYLPDGRRVRLFFTVEDVSSDRVESTLATVEGVESTTPVADRDGGTLFEVTVTGPTLASVASERNAVVRSLVVDGGEARLVVDLPAGSDVRAYVERFRTTYPGVDVVARRDRDRPLKRRQTFQDTLEDRLTDRQLEVLRTAYLSGFFESPRVSTGQDVAALLDITQPTFNHHLRTSERKLFRVLFEDMDFGSDA